MPKRTKAPRKSGKRGEAASRYAAARAKWETRRKDLAGAGDWFLKKPELPLDAAPFFQTLRVLGDIMQDRQFAELRARIIQSGLVDMKTGRWSRYRTTLEHPLTKDACEMIEILIAGGMSERLAIAEAVAELALTAASFESACKAAKRMLDESRKLVGQKHR
jgi:hypothetical protein